MAAIDWYVYRTEASIGPCILNKLYNYVLGTEMGEFEKQALRQQRPVPINLQPSVGDIGTIQRKKRILNTGDAVNVGCGSHCGARKFLIEVYT